MKINTLPPIDSFAISKNTKIYEDFLSYYEEAQFAIAVFENKINNLNKNFRILEVGSGIGLFSNYLYSIGFTNITCVEPDSQGFGSMLEISRYVSSHPKYFSNKIEIHNKLIENFSDASKYDFIFSINVMEHVTNPSLALKKITQLLKPTGEYYFICPNYKFPYETHFNVPILINKKITRIIFSRNIKNAKFYDSSGLWESLNWITPKLIEETLNNKFLVTFQKEAVSKYFDRFKKDKIFERRKGKVIKVCAILLKTLILNLNYKYLPIIECSIRTDDQHLNSK